MSSELCMQMPLHVFYWKEMSACLSCMIELTESCDLLSHYLLFHQQGVSWSPPLRSLSPWAKKLPLQEVSDIFLIFFEPQCNAFNNVRSFKDALIAKKSYTLGLIIVPLPTFCPMLNMRAQACLAELWHYAHHSLLHGQAEAFGFKAFVCDWPLWVWCLHYAKIRRETDLTSTNKQAYLHFADLARPVSGVEITLYLEM